MPQNHNQPVKVQWRQRRVVEAVTSWSQTLDISGRTKKHMQQTSSNLEKTCRKQAVTYGIFWKTKYILLRNARQYLYHHLRELKNPIYLGTLLTLGVKLQ